MPEKKQQKREDFTMIITTTPSVEGRAIREYKGIAFGEVITGVNFMKDLGAGLLLWLSEVLPHNRRFCRQRNSEDLLQDLS